MNLDGLNKEQRLAAETLEGPVLILAGAGSGKTRALTYRVANLIDHGVAPWHILAITFTNKAAKEMKERVSALTGEKGEEVWVSTFHSMCARILRRDIDKLGYTRSFTIYDEDDQSVVLKELLKHFNIDDKMLTIRELKGKISDAKNKLLGPDEWFRQSEKDFRCQQIHDIYDGYEKRLKGSNALDFDDLLVRTLELFADHPPVLESYRQRFQYVHVDEYQDTNFAQHLIVKRLCEGRGNLCVVGDDAQSIYSFRGANIDNILQFKQLYPGCQIFKLERNYRSTQNIVNAANSLIRKNTAQIPKQVYSEKEEGSKLQVLSSYSDYEEAYAVAARVHEMRRQMPYADMAVLYRTNAQSRILEEAMRKRNIPYRVYGGLSFYQRKEVKDVISYFRLVINPHDEEAFKRVINYPTRGIGDTTVSKLVSAATTYGVSLWTVLQSLSDYAVPVNAGTAKKLAAFRELIDSFRERNQELPADEIATAIVKESGIVALLAQDHSTEGIGKFENLQELLKGIAEFCQIRQEEGNTQVSLGDFLAEVSLLTDQDQEGDENTDKVTLMTVHAAKGLEFGAVFVVGLEEELFPSAMSKDNPRAIEEERRLFYVAITRAERHCTLSFARSRFKNGQTTMCIPSRFLRDIDLKYLETEDGYRRPEADSSVSERKPESRPAFTSPLQQAQMRETPSAGPRKLTRMTAAPVSSAAEQDFSDFQIGMRVRHGRFGEGVILSFDGDGNNRKALIEFDNSGQKQLFLKFARLEKM